MATTGARSKTFVNLPSAAALFAATGLTVATLAAQPAEKIEIVSATGCLKQEAPDTWMLVNATDPVPSSANAPPTKDVPSTPPLGKNRFKLIGVSVFNLPSHREHTILVKGLLIKAAPVSRLNVTSVTMVAGSCAAAGK